MVLNAVLGTLSCHIHKVIQHVSITLLSAIMIVFPSLMILLIVYKLGIPDAPKGKVPVSVNYHFTRRCNKTCGFCFHTAKTSFKLSEPEAEHGLSLLKEAGMRKINFAGGEPFLYKTFLGHMARFCKEQLHLESVSVVTNGSLVDEKFLREYGRYIDIMAVSCDSFDEATNVEIGRGSGDQVTKLFEVADLCRKYGVMFKVNTVVCHLNYHEDMNHNIKALAPFRWKCFQVLMVAGENDSENTLRDVRKFQISDAQYEDFCERHKHQKCFVAEPNSLMAKSYLILDEYMRFLDREGRQPSHPILEVGVKKALEQVFWDEESFVKRGGIFDWSKNEEKSSGCGTGNENLDW